MRNLLCLSWLAVLFIGCGSANYQFDEAAGEDQPAKEAEPQAQESTREYIIYEARISLVVEDIEQFEKSLPDLIEKFEARLDDSTINRRQGRRRSGIWVVGVPSKRLAEFLTEVGDLGIVEQQGQTAENVTRQYLDLETRIKTKQELEKRILSILKTREGQLADILAAERELARVRGEIESMQTQLRNLAHRVKYSSVTINAREERDYVPKKAPDFAGKIGTAWRESLKALGIAGENSVIAIVAIAPWIIPLAVVFIGGWLLLKKCLSPIWRKIQSLIQSPTEKTTSE